MTEPDEWGRTEPPLATDEAATLLGFLDFHRATLAWKRQALDAEALATTTPTSSITLGGLLKHLALVEDVPPARQRPPTPVEHRRLGRRPPMGVALSHRRHPTTPTHPLGRGGNQLPHRGDEGLTTTGLDHPIHRPFSDGRAPTLRWVLLHMIEEYARHNGHADLIRESLDGQTGE